MICHLPRPRLAPSSSAVDFRRALGTTALLALSACGTSPDSPAQRAHSLEARLLAPCCWVQTLDVHESPVAAELRAEIEQRIRGGEAPQIIEDEMAQRFGERIRALPRGSEPRGWIGLVMGAAMLGFLALIALAVRKWARRGSAARTVAQPRDEYDDRIDAELALLDDE